MLQLVLLLQSHLISLLSSYICTYHFRLYYRTLQNLRLVAFVKDLYVTTSAYATKRRSRLRSSRGSADKPRLNSRIIFDFTTVRPGRLQTPCLASLPFPTQKWIAQIITDRFAPKSSHHAADTTPCSRTRNSSTMIKAIFYSKFDTQEGRVPNHTP